MMAGAVVFMRAPRTPQATVGRPPPQRSRAAPAPRQAAASRDLRGPRSRAKHARGAPSQQAISWRSILLGLGGFVAVVAETGDLERHLLGRNLVRRERQQPRLI